MSKPAPNWPVINGIRSASVPIEPVSPSGGYTPTRRNACYQSELITQPHPGVSTVPDILSYCARTHGNRNALGYRDVISIHEEKKEVVKNVGGKEVKEVKTWKYFELSEYRYLSYVQVLEAANELSAALVELGVGKGDIFNVYSQTG